VSPFASLTTEQGQIYCEANEILQLICERNLIQVCSHLKKILKICMTLPIKSCEAERNFSVSNDKQISISRAGGKTELSFSLHRKYYKSLSYEEALKEYAAKNVEKSVTEMCQAVNKNIMLFL
jgi:hypothetical protein